MGDDRTPSSAELPLFPLHTVLFPGGSLALRVFEPRYLDMIARCLRDGRRFGVVAIEQGSEVGFAETFSVGTTAEVVDWSQQSGGLLAVTVVGRDRFRVHRSERRPDGLYVAEVAWLAAGAFVPLPAKFARLAELARAAPGVERLGPAAAFEDAEWVGCRLAEVLALPVSAKQALLELDDPLERLDRLTTALGPA